MPQGLNARVTQLECLGRQEHFDRDGGGTITRVIYCEPYTSHKRVITALKGTVYTQGGGLWKRLKPHADPLYPWFYCNDVQVEPAFPSSVRASPSKKFTSANFFRQLLHIQAAMNVIDDFDGASLLDNLTPAEIAAGGVDNIGEGDSFQLNTKETAPIESFNSRGRCGAKVTATYSPLMFQTGLLSNQDQFDFVDPQWEPLTISTATGRSLSFYSPTLGFGPPATHNGLTDTYALPEVVWRFSIRRLMVPFIPAYTIAMFANKVNATRMDLGSLTFPAGTVRMETPEIITQRAPDGNMMHEIKLKFLIRRLYDEYYDPGAPPVINPSFRKGWIGWNWGFGIPSSGVLDPLNFVNPQPNYYPIVWNGGLFQTFGDNHAVFLNDILETDMTLIFNGGMMNQRLDGAPFQAGFYEGQ